MFLSRYIVRNLRIRARAPEDATCVARIREFRTFLYTQHARMVHTHRTLSEGARSALHDALTVLVVHAHAAAQTARVRPHECACGRVRIIRGAVRVQEGNVRGVPYARQKCPAFLVFEIETASFQRKCKSTGSLVFFRMREFRSRGTIRGH